MDHKRISIEAQDYDKVAHFEASVTHWSKEHTRLAIGALDALSTVKDLTGAKNGVVAALCKTAGIDTDKIVQIRLVREGDQSFMDVMIHDQPLPDMNGAAPVEHKAEANTSAS